MFHAHRLIRASVVTVIATLLLLPRASVVASTAGVIQSVPGTNRVADMACIDSTTCYAVGDEAGGTGAITPVSNGTVGAPSSVADTTGINGIACPTSSICYAVGYGGTSPYFGTVVPIINGTIGPVQTVTDVSTLYAVACPSAGICYAVGGTASGAAVLSITNGQIGSPALVAGVSDLRAIACPTAHICYVVGTSSPQGPAVIVPLTDGTIGTVQTLPGIDYLATIACSDATTCYAGGGHTPTAHTVIVPIAAGIAGTPLYVDGVQDFVGMTCKTATLCYAVGYSGTAGVVVPIQSGSAGALLAVPGTGVLIGAACIGQSACYAMGDGYIQGLPPAGVIVRLSEASSPGLEIISAVSNQQYTLTASDGASWQDMDTARLTVTLMPTTDTTAVLGGNSDLWTSSAGYNQDLGIWISGGAYGVGQVVAWKESGGFAGTFSPNAAYVQTVVQLQAGVQYQIKLEWKANRPDSGTIWAGAGPILGGSSPFSPTRLTAELIPTSSDETVTSVSSTQQYTLTDSDGKTWQDMDTTNLAESITPTADGNIILSGNSDLWTSSAGYNQDIGIWMSGGSYGSGQVVAWKESGGFAGTFSPNAAFVQAVLPVQSGVTYQVKLQWKSNKTDPGTIWAGAGPIPSGSSTYSPTRLTAEFLPSISSTTVTSASSTQQYALTNSDGATWQSMDGSNLSQTIVPSSDVNAIVSGNSDLWTSSAGDNQDIGIWISGGSYGAGRLVAWKESGGFAGTFSPNAAYVQTVLPLQSGTHYQIQLVWKSNKPDPGTIWAGAGPIPSGSSTFSPTRLTVKTFPIS